MCEWWDVNRWQGWELRRYSRKVWRSQGTWNVSLICLKGSVSQTGCSGVWGKDSIPGVHWKVFSKELVWDHTIKWFKC